MYVLRDANTGRYLKTSYYGTASLVDKIGEARVYRSKGAASNSRAYHRGRRQWGAPGIKLDIVEVHPFTVAQVLELIDIATVSQDPQPQLKALLFDIQNG